MLRDLEGVSPLSQALAVAAKTSKAVKIHDV
jgi:hypothetical protein